LRLPVSETVPPPDELALGLLPPLLPPQAVRARLLAARAPTTREKRVSFTVRSSKDVCVSSCGHAHVLGLLVDAADARDGK
jgi:hypothetical protein